MEKVNSAEKLANAAVVLEHARKALSEYERHHRFSHMDEKEILEHGGLEREVKDATVRFQLAVSDYEQGLPADSPLAKLVGAMTHRDEAMCALARYEKKVDPKGRRQFDGDGSHDQLVLVYETAKEAVREAASAYAEC